MNPQELRRLLQHIVVWIPHNNPIRVEVLQMIEQIKAQHPQ